MEDMHNPLEQIHSKERLKALEASGEYLFHGSPFAVDTFEPRQAYNDIDNERVTDGEPAVFASEEIETPIFRSIFHESRFDKLNGSFELGFTSSDEDHTIHANEAAINAVRDETGYVYIFKRSDFALRRNKEWISASEVKPVSVFHSTFDDIGIPISPSQP